MLIITFILLLIASIYDIKYRKIPNVLVLLLFLVGIFSAIYFGSPMQKLMGLIFPSIVLLIPYAFNKTGAGDVKLIAATGLILGATINTAVLFLSLVFVLVFNVILKLLGKKPASSVPFSPFVCVGYVFFLLVVFLYQHLGV